MEQESRRAVVYSFVRIPYLVVYGLVLVALLIWCMSYTFHDIGFSTPASWWHGDIPWFALTVVGWGMTLLFRSSKMSRHPVVTRMDGGLFQVDGGKLSGIWRPFRRCGTTKKIQPVWTLFIAIIALLLVLDCMNVWRAFGSGGTPWAKESSVQGMCIAVVILSHLFRLQVYRKFPYQLTLKQKGRFLTLALEKPM